MILYPNSTTKSEIINLINTLNFLLTPSMFIITVIKVNTIKNASNLIRIPQDTVCNKSPAIDDSNTNISGTLKTLATPKITIENGV